MEGNPKQMRYSLVYILLFLTLFYSQCTDKKGKDELVFLSDVQEASSEVFIAYLTDAVEREPEGADKYLKLAEIYNSRNQPDMAASILLRAEEENPENVDILLGLAAMYLENEDTQALSKTLNKIRKADPDNIDFLKISAGYALIKKDYTNAVFFANRAMLTNPYDDEIMFLRGSAMLINFDSINALQSFEEAYKLKRSYKNFSKVFDLAVMLGNNQKALNYLTDYSAQNPEMPLCYEQGVYLHRAGDLDSAKTILVNCFLDNNKAPEINYELARIYLEENLTDSARYYINRYLDKKPHAVKAYIFKGNVFEKINQYTNAKEFYETAVQMDSSNRLAAGRLENLERKIAYLQLVKRKEQVQRQVEILKPLKTKDIK